MNLSSYNGAAPLVKTWAEYLQQAHALPSLDIYNLIKYAEPVTSIQPFTRTSFKLKHFEQVPSPPLPPRPRLMAGIPHVRAQPSPAQPTRLILNYPLEQASGNSGHKVRCFRS